MTYNTPQSLLALPPNVKSPDAYRVLGLPSLEADRTRIKTAVDAKLARLATTKDQADPAAWAQASQWVNNAQAILCDVSKKAAYDRKLAAENPGAAQTNGAIPAIDPLAGMLPTPARKSVAPVADPMADYLPPGQPSRMASAGVPASSGLGDVSGGSAAIGVPVVNRRPIRAKRRLPWVPIVLTMFCLFAICALVGIAMMMLQGQDKAISNGGAVLASNQGGNGMTNTSVRNKQPVDPIMGDLGPKRPNRGPGLDGAPSDRDRQTPTSVQPMVEEPVANDPMAGESMTDMPATEPMEPEPMAPEPMVPEPMVPETPTPPIPTAPVPAEPVPAEPVPAEPVPAEPPMAAPTPEELQAGVVALTSLGTAIKQHNWANMKALAEAAEAVAAGPEQKLLSADLYQFVDLVTYYHGAIEKSLQTLASGHELELANQVKVIVVEITPVKLIIRINGGNREYEIAKLPLGITNKLAEMSLSADPATQQAARLCFQAISPVSTPEIRQAAVAELEKMTDEVQGAEPAKLVSVIRFLYSM